MLLFRLNMKILTDAFSDKYAQVTLFSDQDRPCLEAVRPWQKDRPLDGLNRFRLLLIQLNMKFSAKFPVCHLL